MVYTQVGYSFIIIPQPIPASERPLLHFSCISHLRPVLYLTLATVLVCVSGYAQTPPISQQTPLLFQSEFPSNLQPQFEAQYETLSLTGVAPLKSNLRTWSFSQDRFMGAAMDPVPRDTEPPETPIVSMVHHPDDSRWWLSGQANIIFQGRPAFHATYEGANSFRNSAEYKTSLVDRKSVV